jgi:hypothetical protein
VQAYNAEMPGIADAQAALGRAITFVDMYSLLTLDDLADGVHPNDTGFQKIAQGFYEEMVPLLDSMSTGVAARCPWRPARMSEGNLRHAGVIFDLAGRCRPQAGIHYPALTRKGSGKRTTAP